MRVVTIPGIGGSDEHHWQSRWEKDAGWVRFSPASWDAPDVDDWSAALDRAVGNARPILVAHSLGCLTAVRWSYSHPDRISGLFLAAPPDPYGHQFPSIAVGFGDRLSRRISVPALIVSSSNDPYSSVEMSAKFAAYWGAPLVDVGAHGHLNSASNLGDWPEGRNLFTAFAAGVRAIGSQITANATS